LAVATNAWARKPAPSVCGDGICAANETYESCPPDCQPPPSSCNNDGVCNQGEDCLSCPDDCSGIVDGKPSKRYCCGGGTPAFCDPALCGADCGTPSTPFCGDGYVTADEECDANGWSAACDLDCTLAECGDGTLNLAAGEACDDGNTSPGDGCDAGCKIETPPAPYCGDGHLDPGEDCDDGNNTPGDGCDADCRLESPFTPVPSYQFNIGDSIGEGEAADGTIGEAHHETVWSTGYNIGDSVFSLNERFENTDAAYYYENNSSRDALFNHAISGAVMADFAAQANDVIAAVRSGALPDPSVMMIAILLGNNDVCASTLDTMTDPVLFAEQYRAGLDVLAQNPETSSASIHVSSIPAIYWLWNAKYTNFSCRYFVWPFVPCENLLANPGDDCESPASRLDPDAIYNGDGSNCRRRKTFHAKIRDIYNPILRNVLQEYQSDGRLPNAYFVDIFDVQFSSSHVNNGDCFHPSVAGHALLSEEEWCRSQWGAEDSACGP